MKKFNSLKYKLLFFVVMSLPLYLNLFGQDTRGNPVEIYFTDNGNQIHGWLYKSQAASPSSTIILLHGSIGRDGDVFNFGESLSKEGFNVITFNYPGAWQSEGSRTDESALSSVQSAINFAKSESFIQSYESDTADIVLVGYSYGGAMALLASVKDKTIKKVVTVAGGDLSVTASKIEANPEFRESFQQMIDRIRLNPDVMRGDSGEAYVESLLKNRDKYSLKRYSEKLVEKSLLLIVGWLDYTAKIEDNMLPLYRELLNRGANDVKIIAFETDHQITGEQKNITEIIISWLKKDE
ncbi:alpha/beta hydrolase family protein [Sunxiuqinia sp. sy24]|uniref:alpha/beta hydrolase family protein n=1 Tax=Sunxiuqinia sp. sy24 TaxID=3461495 RepID=UPI0040456B3C